MCIYTWICHVALLCISFYTCMLLYIHTWLSIRSKNICYCAYALCIDIICDWPYALYTLQHTATHCNTLQHNAKHCNTLQLDIICDWPYALNIYVTHIYVTLHTSLSTHICHYTLPFPYMHVTLHTLYTYVLLYIRVSIHIWDSTYTFPYIHATLHTLYTYMLLCIRVSLHICYHTFTFPYIYVTLHMLYTYATLILQAPPNLHPFVRGV